MSDEPRIEEGRLYTAEEIDRIIERRVREANLEAWSKGINGSISRHTKAIEDLSQLVRDHMALPMHPQQAIERAKFIEEFGIERLTLEQRRALPRVLSAAARLSEKHKEEIEDSRVRERVWQRLASIAVLVSVTVSILSAAGVFSYLRQHVFHQP